VQSYNQDEAENAAEIISSLINQVVSQYKINKKAIEFIGPSTPAISRIRSYYRRIIFIKDYKSLDKNGRIMRKVLNEVFQVYNEKYTSNKVKVIIIYHHHIPFGSSDKEFEDYYIYSLNLWLPVL